MTPFSTRRKKYSVNSSNPPVKSFHFRLHADSKSPDTRPNREIFILFRIRSELRFVMNSVTFARDEFGAF